MRVKMGATKDGKITAAEVWIAFEAGAYPGSAIGAACMCILAPYDLENGLIDGFDVVVNKPKSAAYRALCGQCWFVIRAGIARPEEIPPEYGVLVGHEHHLELARPAPRRACKPDFPTWMALARATPLAPPDDDPQSPL